MQIIPPILIGPDELDQSNVAITETPWEAGTYDTGVQRSVGIDLYEVVAVPDTSDEPVAGAAADPPTWIRLGVINRFRMFDFVIGEKTVQTGGPIDVTLDAGGLNNGVALFEVEASSVQVIVDDPVEGVVYNKTANMVDNSNILDFYDYFFAPQNTRTEVAFVDLPAYASATIQVIIDNGESDTSVGELIVGRLNELGVTLLDFNQRIEDFSRKERDVFGNFIIVERRFAKIATYGVSMANSFVPFVFNAMSSVRARPVVYIGDDAQEETITLGFYDDLNILRQGPTVSEMTLEVQGLT